MKWTITKKQGIILMVALIIGLYAFISKKIIFGISPKGTDLVPKKIFQNATNVDTFRITPVALQQGAHENDETEDDDDDDEGRESEKTFTCAP